MADSASPAATTAEISTPKKSAAAKKTKTARAKASHPPTAVMVSGAVKNLKERGGSSLQAIKKYISSTYKIDAEKLAPFIKKYIKASVASGTLVQTKGKGASGSFKLAAGAASGKKAGGSDPGDKKGKKAAGRPAGGTPRTKKSDDAAAKRSPARKAAVKPKKAAGAKRVAVATSAKPKPKASPKAKKTAKVPTKKPKSPKPRTTKPKAAASRAAKKTSPKKK